MSVFYSISQFNQWNFYILFSNEIMNGWINESVNQIIAFSFNFINKLQVVKIVKDVTQSKMNFNNK